MTFFFWLTIVQVNNPLSSIMFNNDPSFDYYIMIIYVDKLDCVAFDSFHFISFGICPSKFFFPIAKPYIISLSLTLYISR